MKFSEIEESFSQLCMNIKTTNIEVEQFLQAHTDININALSEYGDNGFIQAAFYGNDKIIRSLLLTHTIDQSVKDTALVLSSQSCKSIKVVEFLLDNGANVDTNYLGMYPPPIVQALLMYKKEPEKAFPIVQRLLEKGADLETLWLENPNNSVASFITFHDIDMSVFQGGTIDLIKTGTEVFKNQDNITQQGEADFSILASPVEALDFGKRVESISDVLGINEETEFCHDAPHHMMSVNLHGDTNDSVDIE